jgi:hypothetical protein
VPAAHGVSVGELEPAAHTYPALQLEHDGAPDTLKVPAGHVTAVALVDAAGQ